MDRDLREQANWLSRQAENTDRAGRLKLLRAAVSQVSDIADKLSRSLQHPSRRIREAHVNYGGFQLRLLAMRLDVICRSLEKENRALNRDAEPSDSSPAGGA